MKSTDFAFFMWAEPLAMVVPRPGEEPRIFAFVHPFQSTVTHCVLVIYVPAMRWVNYYYVSHRYGYSFSLPASPLLSSWQCFREFTGNCFHSLILTIQASPQILRYMGGSHITQFTWLTPWQVKVVYITKISFSRHSWLALCKITLFTVDVYFHFSLPTFFFKEMQFLFVVSPFGYSSEFGC